MKGSYSEAQEAEVVLLQPPLDVQPLVMALFMEAEEPYRHREAQSEVLRLQEALEGKGIRVVTVKQALLEGDVEELRALALQSISCEEEARLRMVRAVVEQMEAPDLVELLFLQPALHLVPDPELGRISPDAFYEQYQVSPLFGLMFPRDHFIMTNKGLLLGNFRRKDRRRETQVIRLALKNLGIEPVYQFAGESYLEGGDFATTAEISFIANGMRTNADTIGQMLERDLFGTPVVVEMIDRLRTPAEFHLDHYFNILDETYLAVSEARLRSEHLVCNIYRRENGRYVKTDEELTFAEMCSRLQLRYLALPKTEESRMGTNFLNVGGRRLICTDHLPESAAAELADEGFVLERLPFREMHKQYGSLHCATQTLRRMQPAGTRNQ